MATTVVGLFDHPAEAHRAVQDLLDRAYSRKEISVVAGEAFQDRERAVGDEAGAGAIGGGILGAALGLLVGAGLLTVPGIGPVLAAGPVAAAIGTGAAVAGAGAIGAGIGAATGGLLGALVSAGLPEDEAEYYAEGVRRGGTLVTLRTDETAAPMALAILRLHGALDIARRGAEWRQGGWAGYDVEAGPYDPGARRDPIL